MSRRVPALNFNTRNFDKIFNGSKRTTIRLGDKPFTLGPAALMCNHKPSSANTDITEIRKTFFGSLSLKDAQEHGYTSRDKLKEELKRCYGREIRASDVVTIVCFEIEGGRMKTVTLRAPIMAVSLALASVCEAQTINKNCLSAYRRCELPDYSALCLNKQPTQDYPTSNFYPNNKSPPLDSESCASIRKPQALGACMEPFCELILLLSGARDPLESWWLSGLVGPIYHSTLIT